MVVAINERIVIIVHNYVVRKLIAVDGVLFPATISGPINRIFSQVYGEKYVGVKEKAGAILYSIVHGHSFMDGNKRTGLFYQHADGRLFSGSSGQVSAALRGSADTLHLRCELIRFSRSCSRPMAAAAVLLRRSNRFSAKHFLPSN